jgi:hypothetical protein
MNQSAHCNPAPQVYIPRDSAAQTIVRNLQSRADKAA